MRGREPILPHRQRRIPPHFSWIDHRLVRDGHVQGRSAPALALYLFLVTVADAEGLSWYSDAGLIAYRRPLVQVLDLAPALAPATPLPRRAGEAASLGEILQRLMGGAQ